MPTVYSISDIKVKGIKALQYLKYQDYKLKEFLQQNKGMKLIVDTFGTFKDKVTDENTRKVIRSRRYEVTYQTYYPKWQPTLNFKLIKWN